MGVKVMKRIKRELVEELYAISVEWQRLFQESGLITTEEVRVQESKLSSKRREIEDLFSPKDYAIGCLITGITEDIVFAGLSISRLIKCLDVCGIEVVE